jgi:3-carboxy-cis,cis-muconate cycloisomerase
MAGLANGSAELVMPDRTRGQHAVPVTFGFVVAAWIDELLRHAERLRKGEPRMFVAMLGYRHATSLLPFHGSCRARA